MLKKLIYCFLFCISIQISVAAVPGTITYQGVLTDGSGVLINGTPDIKFEIFLASGGGVAQWNETQPSVSVVNGVFNVDLGSVTPFGALDFSVPYWLQITIDPSGTPTVLSPRIAFNSAGYAQNTKQVLGGTIDNSVIGGTTPAAGSFTTLKMTSGAGDGKVLTSDPDGNASWVDNDFELVNPMTGEGDILFGTGTPGSSYAVLGKGTAGQVLTMNPGATAPIWSDPAAGGGGVDPATVGVAYKTVTETRTNTTVLADDAHLIANWGTGNAGTYIVEFVLGERIDFVMPANNTGGGIDIAIQKVGSGTVSASTVTSMDSYQIFGQIGDRKNIFCEGCGFNDGVTYSTTIRVLLTIDNNVSGIKLQWAQKLGFSSTASSYITAGSYVYYRKLQ